MNIDLGSSTLDVAIAMSLVFFLLSVFASALSEAFAGLLRFRSKDLRKGIEGMLGDSQLVEDLFAHPLIRTELGKDKREVGSGTSPSSPLQRLWRNRKRERGPSYLSARTFALAFGDVVDLDSLSEPVKKQLAAITKVADGALPSEPALEKWFDDAMDRVSGWYKRKSQKVTVVFAVIVAVGLNASAVRIVERLASDPTVRSAVVAQAEATAAEGEFKGEKSGEETDAAANLEQAGNDVETAYGKIDALGLPLMWAKENVPDWTWAGVGSAAVGWLVTIIAISLGAPFWFDTLNKFANLRLAGKKPEGKPNPS